MEKKRPQADRVPNLVGFQVIPSLPGKLRGEPHDHMQARGTGKHTHRAAGKS